MPQKGHKEGQDDIRSHATALRFLIPNHLNKARQGTDGDVVKVVGGPTESTSNDGKASRICHPYLPSLVVNLSFLLNGLESRRIHRFAVIRYPA